ncbi:MAG: hypothetical protein ACKVP4_00750, partial [Hyphomicrobium sp.]
GGVALEYMIDFANYVGASPWFTIPTAADDNYVREMAKLIKERLDGGRKFYIEYSNEVWNTFQWPFSFVESERVRRNMKSIDQYYATRALEMFKIFEEVFGSTERFVRVLSGQAGNAWRNKELLDFPGVGQKVDAFAIAPYFSFDEDHPSSQTIETQPEDVQLEALQLNLTRVRQQIRTDRRLADAVGLPLITYEAGQAVVSASGSDTFCGPVNRHPRMEQLYRDYMDIWRQETDGALLVLLSDVSQFNKYGCWGLSEYLGQSIAETPKLRAVRAYIERLKPN